MCNRETRRPRILLLAYYCNPNRGSEEGVGWNRALETAKHCDTWVITREGDNAAAIRDFLSVNGEIPGLHFEFVPFPASEHRRFDAWLKWFVMKRWHRRALEAARRLHSQCHFDLVHHVTGITFREPGYLWQLDLPFVWGPIGGTDNYPWRFMFEGGLVSAASETLRNVITIAQMRWSRRVKLAMRRADALMIANSSGQQQVQRSQGVLGEMLQDCGLRQVAQIQREPRPGSGPFRILWSGAMVPRKALSLLLRALAKLPPGVSFELRVLGEGEMERRWKRLAQQLGIAAHIEWTGWLPYREALSHYQWADVFAFTSLRDTGGNVIIEAMSNGLPIICLDHQGAHDSVTERCGIKVPVTSPRQVVDELCTALTRLAQDPSLRADMGRAAIDRAGDFLWPRVVAQFLDVYRQVLQRTRQASHSEQPEGNVSLTLSPLGPPTEGLGGEAIGARKALARP